ncbi:hypothetical protein MATR_17980 [Marivirga tractuosa]|uniref:Uncharacterized protein n=1 Tax=Marivirga tractuosa (strain ATCC 23168 / DSM 4126 / NBRC 15989 / NCIMB 1408 / VKM B-1430 / H-43) TaxID=643867 RepID=E4TQ22_MARTH|nr:hypothetical protein Ftrac_0575 [Marivirga tractuosa DSM 4126]BDD14973.1 hypothetical protein MATR_17980 [Marivirga tractuosa]
MTIVEKHIVNSYSKIFDMLSKRIKIKLIEKLEKSLSKNTVNDDKVFYDSFGGFVSDKSAKEIVSEIKANRNFKSRDLNF